MASKVYQIAFQLGAKIQSSMGNAFNAAQKNITGVNKGLNQVQQHAKSANNSILSLNSSLKSITSAAIKLGSAYLSFNAIKGFFSNATENASALEGYRNTLNVVMKDQVKASKAMAWAVDFANRTPFETDSIVEATVRLQSYGLEAQKILPAIGDMAGVMNKDIMQAVEAVADAQTGELERLKEFGITKAMISQKAAEMYRNQEVVNNKGQIVDQKKFNDALMALINERFKGGMEIQANSFKGIMSTISGIWKTGLAQMAGISATGEIIKGSLFDTVKERVKSLSDFLVSISSNGAFEKIGLMLGRGFSFASDMIGKIINKSGEFTRKVSPYIEAVKKQVKWLGEVGLQAFNNIKKAVEENLPAFRSVKDIIKQIGDILGVAFEVAKPTIEWMSNEGFPNVVNLLGSVFDSVSNVYNFINNNWRQIEPIVMGIAGAIAAYKVAMIGLYLAQKAGLIIQTLTAAWSTAVTVISLVKSWSDLWTLAQWGLNAALTANPIGVVVVAIGALITIGVALYKNWDTIKAKAFELWEGIKTAFAPIGEFFQGVFESAWNGIKKFINWIIQGLNKLIGGINSFKLTVPDWLPGGGTTIGFSIPLIPMLAKGTNDFAGGMAIVGEQGPELVNLPRHSQVIPSRKTSSILSSLRQGTSSIVKNQSKNETISINYAPQYVIYGNPDREILEKAANKSRDDFEKRMNDFFARKRRLQFNQA